MPEIVLNGCTPEPLSNYLKALGVLRLLVEQRQDLSAKGFWHNNTFVLETTLSTDELEKFFLYKYQPTPLVAPWNGSSGFYPKDNKKTIKAISGSKAKRFADYRETVNIAQKQFNALELTTQPKDDEKRQLIAKLRNHLPDRTVQWLDACALVTSFDIAFPPLTGSGGNDGNFEFSRTFMQQLQNLIDFETGEPTKEAITLLQTCLFNNTLPGLRFSGKIGQFNPIAAGGANAAPGFDADSRVNSWDYVLMMEGIMLFTSGATRRYEQTEQGTLAYPFTVRPSSVGYGSASEQDEARGEIWIPLWSQPTGLGELKTLFNEGRAHVGDRSAKNGVDFARAVSSLGVNRGLSEFVRYSFQIRNGLSYFATPLGRFQPQFNPQVARLALLDNWLLEFTRVAKDSDAPASVKRAHQQLETAIIDLARNKAKLLDVLIALGAVEKSLGRSQRFVTAKRLPPLPFLRSSEWLKDCDDGSREFRLALSLAMTGLRQRLVRVRGDYSTFWLDEEDGITTWQEGSLVKNLMALLGRVEIEAGQEKHPIATEDEQKAEISSRLTTTDPTLAPLPLLANLDDITAWIEETTSDERIEAIARGLSLFRPFRQLTQAREPALKPSTAYAMLAIVHRRSLKATTVAEAFGRSILPGDLTLPRVPELLAKLATGDCLTATTLATRRLHASGLQPAIHTGIYEPRERTLRIAAALAFPISDKDTAYLLKQIRKFDPNEEKD